LDYNTYLVLPAESAGIVVPALSEATYYSKNSSDGTYEPEANRTLDFKFEPDTCFEEAPEAFSALQKARDASETKYLNEWRKGQELLKEIKELKDKMESLKNAVTAQIDPPTQAKTEEVPF
jgi:hypothetical protein